MEDYYPEDENDLEDDIVEEEEDESLGFDEIVSFTMLMETAVTLIGMSIFFLMFLADIF